MTKSTLIDLLRGQPTFTIGEHRTFYAQGALVMIAMVVIAALVVPSLRDLLGVGPTLFVMGFWILLGSALSVRIELSDGSEI